MTLMQLSLTIKANWLDATAQTTDRSFFREIRGHDIPRNFPYRSARVDALELRPQNSRHYPVPHTTPGSRVQGDTCQRNRAHHPASFRLQIISRTRRFQSRNPL